MSTNGTKPTFRAQRITIKNVAGIQELEFSPNSPVTVISGRNTAGKTSVLKALSALAGVEEGKLLRNGSKRGEVVVVFGSDDGRVLNAERSWREGGTPQTVLTNEDGEDAGGATVMKAIWNAISANPMKFIQADKKERLQILLDTISLEFDENRLSDLLASEDGRPFVDLVEGSTPFDTIELTRKAVYDERTVVNRDVDKAKKTIKMLSADLPPQGEDCEKELKEARSAKERLDNAKTGAIQDAAKLRDEAIAKAHKDYDKRFDGIIAEADPMIADASARVTRWEERQKASAAAGERRRLLEQTQQELAGNEELSQTLTEILGDIDKLKEELLSTLPIEGLEARDGDIYLRGVAFGDLSTAEQLSVAIKVAKLRAGDIGLVAVDRIESLDPETFEAFKDFAEKSGLQFIATRVSTGDLEVSEG